MASPTHPSPTAGSPPYPSYNTLPSPGQPGLAPTSSHRKRSSEAANAPAIKRRKASTHALASNSPAAHPLRQTSFPPDEASVSAAHTPYASFAAGPRSPSVDSTSLVSGSQMSVVAPVKKKRGRKSKAEKAREATPSTAGARAMTVASGGSAGGRGNGEGGAAGGTGAEDEEAANQDDGPVDVAIASDMQTQEEKAKDHHNRSMLINAFSPDQFDRYENWRAASLTKGLTRKLINATISQSVGENIVIGMRAVGKVFIGDIIESARRVQAEWINKTGEKQTDLPTPLPSSANSPSALLDTEGTAPGDGEAVASENRPGPLRPEHIREAYRRYKVSWEGAGVGMNPLWNEQTQSGAERFPVRTGGRRIFK